MTIDMNTKLEEFPLLSRLPLTSRELTALVQQGFVGSEKRGSKTVFRLRFRLDGRQQVRYVSPRDAEALGQELKAWQRAARGQRHVNTLARLARRMLRHRKTTLGPLLEARGLHFHGHAIRQFRNTA